MKKFISIAMVITIFAACTHTRTVQVYNPCNDPLLTALEQKDSLTAQETIAYAELKRNCLNYKTDKEQTEIMAEQSDVIHLGITVYVGTVLGALIWLAVKK